MSIALVAHTIAGSSDGTNLTSSGINTTGANLLVMAVAYSQGSPPTISDSKGNTWVPLTERTGSFRALRFYYVVSPTVGSGHTFSANSSAHPTLAIQAFSGASTSSPFDVENGAGSTSPGSITPTANNEVVLTSAMGDANDRNVGSGFTLADTIGLVSGISYELGLAYKIQTSASAENPTWTGSALSVSAIASFKAATASGPTVTTTSLPNGTVGSAYSQTLAVSGGTGSITWSVVSGSLPAGLSLNSSTGAITGTPTAAGTSSFTVRATDSVSAFDDQALSITINAAAVVTGWVLNPILPRGDMQFWYQYQAGDSADGVCKDYSGNSRDLSTATSNKSILTMNALNGQPGWYFNGSRDPMIYTGSVPFKHFFILASADEATFTTFRGLFTGATTTILVGNNGTDTFFDNSASITVSYYKSDVFFAQNNQKAPVSGVAAFMEIQAPAGITLATALQIGQQTSFTTRLWKGYFYDAFGYNSILNDVGRQRAREYFAMRYQVWPKNAAGLDVFPFAANRTRSEDYDQESFLSQPYSGEPKELVRGNYKGGYSLSFLLREQTEYDATKAFLKQHGKSSPFVFRDYRYYPYRDITVRRTSSLREQGSDVTYRFNYSFDVIEDV